MSVTNKLRCFTVIRYYIIMFYNDVILLRNIARWRGKEVAVRTGIEVQQSNACVDVQSVGGWKTKYNSVWIRKTN